MENVRTTPAEPPVRFRGLPEQRVAGVRVPVAESLRSRLLGLSHLNLERAGPGLLIPRCRSVHTFGMRFAIDIHFLGDDDRLLRSFPATPPRRMVRCPGALDVLELVTPLGLECERGGENSLPAA